MPEHISQIVSKYDDALQKADSEKYQLSILLSEDGFSFCIFSEINNKLLSIESQAFHNFKNLDGYCNLFKKIFHNHPWLKLKYQQVNILYESQKSTLIPSPLYTEQEKENYIKLNFTQTDDQIIRIDKLQNVDAYKLFLVPEKIVHLMEMLFPEHRFSSHASVLIESLIILNKNQPNHKKCYVNVRNSYLDITISEGRKLIYYNSFQYRTQEDFIYYLIFVLDQLTLNPEDIEIVLSGFIDSHSKLFELVYKYVRNITFAQLSNNINYSYIFNDIPSHQYANLINLYLCEL